MRIVLVVGLLAMTALAGCTGNGTEGDTSDSTGGDTLGENGAVVNRSLAQAFTAATDPITITETGTVSADTAVCLDGFACNREIYSIADEMEENQAYQFDATLVGDPSSYAASSVFMFLSYEQGVADYEGTEFDDGAVTISATMLPKADNFIDLIVSWNAGDSQQVNYELTYTLTPITDVILPFSAGKITVPQGGALIVEPVGSAQAVQLWHGNDKWGVFELSEGTTIFENGTTDLELVVVTVDDFSVNVFVLQEATRPAPILSHIPIVEEEISLGDLPDGDNSQGQSWTFDVEMMPLLVGLRYGSFGGCDEPDGCYTYQQAQVALVGPDGTELLSASTGCLLCGGFNSISTDFGDGRLLAGEYEASWSSAYSYSTEVRAVSLSFQL